MIKPACQKPGSRPDGLVLSGRIAKGKNRYTLFARCSGRAQSGLTLVETLVALVILAMVVMGAFALLGQSANFAASEQDRLAAGIVADNILITELARSTLPELGEREDLVAMAGRNWVYLETVQDVGERAMLITVEVRGEDSQQVLASVSGVRETQ